MTSGVTVRLFIVRGCGVLMSEYEWRGVEGVGAYHERERLCPEGMRVREVAHVHYANAFEGR